MIRPSSVRDINGVRYELAGLLGRGGQGAVYAVKGGRRAVKIVNGCDPTHQARMRNQLAHVRRLPLGDLSLAKPLEMLRPPLTGYVMVLLTGMVPLNTLLRPPKGQISLAEWYLSSGGLRRRLLVLGRASSILATLHGKGLAYADPSPANIFVSEGVDWNEVWFVDTDNLCYESAPGAHGGVFTPFYGAPELVRGESGVNTLTDVHAFAVIAFQMLTLNHPLLGDLVNDGDPELEEQALAGRLPWIDDSEDDCNRASSGVPRARVLSPRLQKAFGRVFGPGKSDATQRPGASEWAERLFSAADSTLTCSDCAGSYYFTQPECTWCGVPAATLAIAVFKRWDPRKGPHGGLLTKPRRGKDVEVRVGHGVVSQGHTFYITRRLAFGLQSGALDGRVIAVTLTGGEVYLKSLDGENYRLVSPSGNRESEVTERGISMALTEGKASYRLHFGDREHHHNVMSFELRSGSSK